MRMMNENIINVYCDESSHMQNDNHIYMVIGGVWINKNKTKSVCADIRALKEKFGLRRNYEIKWNRLLKNKHDFYKEIIKYFFDSNDLSFRCIVASKLGVTLDTYSDWYYKMYYWMLIYKIVSVNSYNIYIDIRGKRSGGIKVENLRKCLSRKKYDFNSQIIKNLQIIDSKETELLQLADFFCGAIGYENNEIKNKNKNKVRVELINYIKELSGKSLIQTTLQAEPKFNIFFWNANTMEIV
jgi:hypothetical protein